MKKFVIVGGGATHTPGVIASLLEKRDELQLGRLCFYDIDERRNSLMCGFAKIYFGERAPDVEVSCTTDIQEAFADADFLFVQIRVGCMEQRELDEQIPLRHGVVGQETCGAGGFAFAMRNIPAMLYIVEKALAICPNAWILNYSNPEAIISEAVYQAYPHAKILCICDMPVSVELVVAAFLGIAHSDLTFDYFGLNHFGWFTHVYDKDGYDHLPDIVKAIKDNPKLELTDGDTESKNFLNVSRIIRLFGSYIPIGYLQYYLFPDEMVELSNPNYTRASYILQHRNKSVFEDCENVMRVGTTESSPLVAGIHGNYIVDIACSIINDRQERFIVNTMNNGAISNFSPDAVVEIPCYIGAAGISPISIGSIPTFEKALMELQKGYEKLTVQAALEGSYYKALHALMLNKTISSYQVAKNVLDELMEANRQYWPVLK